MTGLHRIARLLGLIPSRHPAGSLTGWSCLARITRAAFDDFSKPRAGLAEFPQIGPVTFPSYSPKDAT